MLKDAIKNYLQSISKKFSYEETSEMGYRTDFENLLKEIFQSINVSRFDHDAKAIRGNKPDFVVKKNDVPILYIEAKDIGVSLDKIEKSEQMSRYYGYANLVLTDYVEFRFYRNGIPYGEPIKIANINKFSRTLTINEDKYEYLIHSLIDFAQSHKEPIRSGKHLSKIMGGKAQRIRDNIRQFINNKSESNTEITQVYETLKKLLVHDLTLNNFADMYAQTLVYGLFVARYYDETPNNFTRQEARDLIPKSNPFLQHFFDHIVGPNFDKRLEYIVDELCEVFTHADVHELMKEYFKDDLWGGTHRGPDPVIHFYEDFLKEYDPELRKRMGAYYTPQPVVHFISHSVDYLLKNRFGLPNGLADTTKSEKGVHRVQILDPAVGTGTFISAVIGVIYAIICEKGQKGRWPAYVHNDLLPRLHGFELMMAPYTIAHLKLGMAFKQTGFMYFNRRLGIYLTNTLEESASQQGLFTAFGLAESIAEESKEAAVIKNKTPIMVVIGNPPYSGESSNAQYKGNDVYKVEPSGGKLQEKNSKWLNDDYVKFIRYAEDMVEKTGEGIVAMITAHGYIDNPTFRGMRWHLMNTFDEIFVLDLHGNSNKKEKAPDGGEDNNVFDIKTGVAILFGIKKKNNKKSDVKIYHADLYGKRQVKFEFLDKNLVNSVKWKKITPTAPNFEWVERNSDLEKEYNKSFSINKLFKISSVGIVTSRDAFIIDSNKDVLKNRLQDFIHTQSPQEAKSVFELKENKKWKVSAAMKHDFDENNIFKLSYRPFDTRYIYYHDDFIERSRKTVMKNFLLGDNVGLVTARSNKNPEVDHFFVSENITEAKLGESSTQSAVFPLFVHLNDKTVKSNLYENIVNEIEKIVGKTRPEDIFSYIYATLYCHTYRTKFKSLLKKDFPKIPYPKDTNSYAKLVSLGSEMRDLHLLKSKKINDLMTTYPIAGSDIVELSPEFNNGKLFINKDQYFGEVPEAVWNFHIGGYLPIQRWLKERKGQTLSNEDLEYYQKIIVAIAETIKVMSKIEEVWNEN